MLQLGLSGPGLNVCLVARSGGQVLVVRLFGCQVWLPGISGPDLTVCLVARNKLSWPDFMSGCQVLVVLA